jgi:hypothetical protein
MNRKFEGQPEQTSKSRTADHRGIRRGDDLEPIHVPDGHVGPIVLASGRMVYWTGRVAIGLRHDARHGRVEPLGHGGEWLQSLMLRSRKLAAKPPVSNRIPATHGRGAPVAA